MIKNKKLFINYPKYVLYCIIIKLTLTLLTSNTTYLNGEYTGINNYYSIIFAIVLGAIVGTFFTMWYNYFKNRKFLGNIVISYIASSIITQILLVILYLVFLVFIYSLRII